MKRWIAGGKRAVWLRKVGAAVMLLSLSTSQSWAWGREGHRLTALVAESYLTPETKAAVKELLGRESLAEVAPWADEYRTQHPETAPWHFVDIPKADASYDRHGIVRRRRLIRSLRGTTA